MRQVNRRIVELSLGSGLRVEIPVVRIRGIEDGPRVTLTAGIHGAEYASIEAALRTAQTLAPEHVRGELTVVPIVNVPAFYERSIYVCPLDGVNLNRVFPGRADGSPSEVLAHQVFQRWIHGADLYIDLHGGDLVEALEPFVAYHAGDDAAPDVIRRSREHAGRFGIRYVVATLTPGLTHAAAAAEGTPAVLAEAGGQGLMPEVEIRRLQEGVLRVLHGAGALTPAAPVPGPGAEPVHLAHFPWVRSEHRGLFYARVEPGDRVEEGSVVGRVTDLLGEELAEVRAPATGIVMFVVTSLATNPGDPLLAIGVPG